MTWLHSIAKAKTAEGKVFNSITQSLAAYIDNIRTRKLGTIYNMTRMEKHSKT